MIHFLDNTLSIATMKTLIRHPPGTSWYAFTRVSKQLTDFDFCLALRKAGCVMLKLGIESGSQDVLDKMNKGTKIDEISLTLKNLSKAESAHMFTCFSAHLRKNTIRLSRRCILHRAMLNISTFLIWPSLTCPFQAVLTVNISQRALMKVI